jgi:von Willebrand factor A domain-containing protein 7
MGTAGTVHERFGRYVERMRLITCLLATALSATIAGLTEERTSAQSEQRPRIRFGPGVCGPIDPSYVRIANETGGTVFPLSTDEVAKSSQTMMSAMYDDLILWASGEGERTYAVPVDSSVTSVLLSASFDGAGGALTVTSPSGETVQGGPGIQDTPFNCGRVLTVDSPSAGTWQLRVAPTGRFWLKIEAKSELSLVDVEFVRPGGRPGHEGLFKIEGQPLAGRPATLRVELTPDATSPTFELVSVDAHSLQTVDLQSVGDDEFVGTFTPPSERFRVMARGVDRIGVPFQRMRGGMFRGEIIEVIPPVAHPVTRGTIAPVTFTVRNYGPPVRLTMTATGDKGTLLPVQPAVMPLAQNAEGHATVRVTVPEDAAPESLIEVFFTAAGEGDSTAVNYAKAELIVRP